MKEEPGFVVCINNQDYPASLELHKIYQVVSDEKIEVDGEIRVVDESGEDYIYPAQWFVAVDLPLAVEESFLKAA
ncbi:MAG TPA: hypothetical protein VGB00_12340 [Pyrinomonadaceae bacterium]|jgi:hypothetical protein